MSSDRQDTVWQSPEIVRQYLTGVSGAMPLKAEQLDVMLRLVAANPISSAADFSFLDVGCGDGIMAAALLSHHPAAHGTLLDFSEPMLAAARLRLADRTSQLAFIQADYADPAWVESVNARAPFDVIVSGFSIHHQPDASKRRIYQDIFSLLRPGGLFVNLEHVSSPTPWTESLFQECFVDSLWHYHTQLDDGLTRQQVADQLYHRPDKIANMLAPVEVQCEWLRDIGFADVDCFFKIFELAIFGGRRPD